LERKTFDENLAGETIVRGTESVVLMGLDAHVRFRSFRDELSLTVNNLPRRQESQPGFLAKTGKNSGGLGCGAGGRMKREALKLLRNCDASW
jgi:hypothetical protein